MLQIGVQFPPFLKFKGESGWFKRLLHSWNLSPLDKKFRNVR
jgi:hypothetical protein